MSEHLAIDIKELCYAYRSDWLLKRITCLHSVNLEVRAGEAFGFLGHNGAGKTTTIKCLLNLIWPKSGSIKIFGVDSRSIEARRCVGYLPEQPYFYDHLSVYETVEMYAALAGIKAAELKSACLPALERVGLEQRLNARMRTLSKGLTQRVALAQAMVAKPRLLLLDEPFSGLDPLGRKEFSDIFSELKQSGTTLFMSSHILSDVQALCDRFSIMVKGELKGVFAMDQIASLIPGQHELVLRLPAAKLESLPAAAHSQQTQNQIRLRYADAATANQALQIALREQMAIESFHFAHGGLEELFIKLVKESNLGRFSA